MSKKLFTKEEVEILYKNKYVKKESLIPMNLSVFL